VQLNRLEIHRSCLQLSVQIQSMPKTNDIFITAVHSTVSIMCTVLVNEYWFHEFFSYFFLTATNLLGFLSMYILCLFVHVFLVVVSLVVSALLVFCFVFKHSPDGCVDI